MVGFPEKYCRVVASKSHGDAAFVLIQTGSDGRSYLYGVHCSRRDGRWHEGSGSNGATGWDETGPDPSRGVVTMGDDAPADWEAVRVEFDGSVQEEVVRNGVYLAAWWNVAAPPLERFPRLIAIRINGQWLKP